MSSLLTKRLMGELKILNQNRTSFVQGVQDPDDYKTFYFLLKPDDEPYKGGMYIGQIQISDEYPTKAPVFKMLTPSGRFEIQKAICLTNSHYHPEHSTAAWNINSMIIAFISIFIVDDTTGISHIKDTKENRKYMAEQSHQYNIQYNPRIYKLFDQFINEDFSLKTEEEILQYIEASKPVKKSKKDKSEKVDEVKEEVKPEVKEEVKPEVKEEVKPEVKPEVQPEVQPEVKPEVQPEVKPEVQPEVKPEPKDPPPVKVTRKYVKKTKTEQEPEPEVKQEVQPETIPKKKIVKRVVKPKTVEEPPQEELPQEELPQEELPKKKVIKKVVKTVVKKVVKKVTKPEEKYELDVDD